MQRISHPATSLTNIVHKVSVTSCLKVVCLSSHLKEKDGISKMTLHLQSDTIFDLKARSSISVERKVGLLRLDPPMQSFNDLLSLAINSNHCNVAMSFLRF